MSIRTDLDGEIAVVTIDRPAKLNSFTGEMLAEFVATIERLGADREVRALVVRGAGEAFSSGADVGGLRDDFGAEAGEGLAAFEPSLWLVDCPKPVIAAVDGVAVGMGAEIATQADLRVATPRARFGWIFSRLGLVPDTGAASWLLPHMVGLPRALDLLYSGEFLTAPEAHERGFVTRLVEPGELQEMAIAEARRLCAGYPESIARIKALAYGGLGREQEQSLAATRAAMRESVASDDFRAALAAFLER